MSADLKNLTVEEARRRMLAALNVTPPETVALAQAAGRVLAEPVSAVRDQPPFDASSMDGWAARDADLAAGALAVVGESAAGRGWTGTLAAGQAVRIFTGAPVPQGADRVVIQEEALRDGDGVRLDPVGDNRNIRPRGADFRAGEALMQAGDRLDPWRLSLAAAAGRDRLSVRRRPRVAVLTGGDELIPPGSPPGPWQIFDSAGPALCALVQSWGAETAPIAAMGDRIDSILQAFEQAADADLVVTVGGASVGDHDLIKPALARTGLALAVETVAVRPGKPTWFGQVADGRPVLGLPGNPASALVCAELFLRPAIQTLCGADARPPIVAARLDGVLKAGGPREHWMRAALHVDGTGALIARPFADQDSSLVTVFAQADALIRQPAGAPAQDGGVVWVLPLGRRPGR